MGGRNEKEELISLSLVVARGARKPRGRKKRRKGATDRPAVLDFVIGEDKNDGLSSVG